MLSEAQAPARGRCVPTVCVRTRALALMALIACGRADVLGVTSAVALLCLRAFYSGFSGQRRVGLTLVAAWF